MHITTRIAVKRRLYRSRYERAVKVMDACMCTHKGASARCMRPQIRVAGHLRGRGSAEALVASGEEMKALDANPV